MNVTNETPTNTTNSTSDGSILFSTTTEYSIRTTIGDGVQNTTTHDGMSPETIGAIVGGSVGGVVVIVIVVIALLICKKRRKNKKSFSSAPPSNEDIKQATKTRRKAQPLPKNKKSTKKEELSDINQDDTTYVNIVAQSDEPGIYTREGATYYMGTLKSASTQLTVPEEEYGNEEIVRTMSQSSKNQPNYGQEQESDYFNDDQGASVIAGIKNKAFTNKDDKQNSDDDNLSDYENDFDNFRKTDEHLYENFSSSSFKPKGKS